MAINPLQLPASPQINSRADFGPLQRLGLILAAERGETAQNEQAYRDLGGGQGQPQSGGFLQDIGRRFGLIPEPQPAALPGTPPTRAPVSPSYSGGGDAGGIGTMTPNAKKWFDYAILPVAQGGLGLSHAQAAGKVANLQAESSPNITPWGVSGDAGTAHGAAQWREGRLRNLVEFSRAKGLDYKSTEAQQAFMRHEYLGNDPQVGNQYGGGSEGKAYSALTATNSPRDAATAVNRYYERSADRTGGRERNAEALARRAGAPVVARGGDTRYPPSEGPGAYYNALDQAANVPPSADIPPSEGPGAQFNALNEAAGAPTDTSAQSRNYVPPAGPVEPLPPARTIASPEARAVQNLTSDQPAAAAGFDRETLARMYRNPATRGLAAAVLQKQMDPGSWSFQQIGDKLVGTHNKTGQAKVVMEDTKPLIVGGAIATRDPSRPGGYAFHTPPDTKPIHQKEDEVIHIPNGMGGFKTIGAGNTKAQRELEGNTYKADVLQLDGRKREFMIANGRLPTSEDVAPGDRRRIDKLQDAIDAADSAKTTLKEMETLNETAFKGLGAGKRAWAAANLLPADTEWGKRGRATIELNTEMTRSALNQLKAIFTGSQSKEELAVLRTIQGAIDNPDTINANIFERARQVLELKQQRSEAQQESIRTGEAYKPGGARKSSGGLKWSIEP